MFSIALGGFEDVPDESNFKANIYEFTPTAFDPKYSGVFKLSLIDSEAEMPTRRKREQRERLSEINSKEYATVRAIREMKPYEIVRNAQSLN
jgi:hypothetical protein